MDRLKFLKLISTVPLMAALKIHELKAMTLFSGETDLMPVLFLGHGSPMNAIEENEFVTGFRNVAKILPEPTAILCISAHWESRGTFVTVAEKPGTIHDFGGFPQELFEVQYPAPGDPVLAKEIKTGMKTTIVGLDEKWGLDHGCWSVVKHLYPIADVPVLQMSLDYYKTPAEHYSIAKELSWLRKKGVLIVGSGNMVHNLGLIAWDKLNTSGFAYDWALEAADKIKNWMLTRDHQSLINYQLRGKAMNLAIPTPDHFLPLLYTLALLETNETVSLFNDKPVAGSLTMTSVISGKY